MPVVEILFLQRLLVTHLKNGIFACNMDNPVPVLQRQRIAGVEVQELGAENVLVAGADQV